MSCLVYSKVIIPRFVVDAELQNDKPPQVVREWIRKLPSWVEVQTPKHPVALGLQIGEEHAIALALELSVPILLDEKEARRIAESKGIVVIGTIGIIERASKRNLLDIKAAFSDLKRTNFHISIRFSSPKIEGRTDRTDWVVGEVELCEHL